MAYNRKQQELSPSAFPIKKKSKPPNTSNMVDKMAKTVTHFEDIIRTKLTAMRNKFTSHMSVVQSLFFKLDITGDERTKESCRRSRLKNQLVDLQDRNRQSNLRLVGLPEGSKKDDPIGFLKRSIPMWLPSLAGKEIEVK